MRIKIIGAGSIRTPPDTHLSIALEAIAEAPRAIMIEKPVCTPDLGEARNTVGDHWGRFQLYEIVRNVV